MRYKGLRYMEIRINRVQHVGIPVADMEVSLRFMSGPPVF